jgi:CubicO group peptidase (beta-lactamase class C family)
VWHLGSITKSITSTLVARLVEAGAVSWDDTAGELLEDVAPDMHEAYRSASFRHLLSHHAGMPKDIPMPLFMTYSRDATNVRDERRSYAREALRMTPVGVMEAAFFYSNNGYVVVGAMLETKLDATWEELVRLHVFDPLRLTTAGVGPPGEIGKLTQPVGHFFRGGHLIPLRVGEKYADNPYALGPVGRVHMSLDDVLSYLRAHRDTIPFLKPETWQMLHTPQFGGKYAMGWVTAPNGDVSHDGSNTGWYAHALFNKRAGTAVAAATNEGRPQRGTTLDRVSRGALAAIGQ